MPSILMPDHTPVVKLIYLSPHRRVICRGEQFATVMFQRIAGYARKCVFVFCGSEATRIGRSGLVSMTTRWMSRLVIVIMFGYLFTVIP